MTTDTAPTGWDPDAEDDGRTDVLQRFAAICGLPPIIAVRQLGRDPRTARFTLVLSDGRDIHIGTIDTLTSRTKMDNVLMVAASTCINPEVKAGAWRNAVAALVTRCAEVAEVDDEPLSARVADWIDQHTTSARDVGDDRAEQDACVRTRSPFERDGMLHVSAEGLAKWVRREYSESVPISDLRQALRDLGYDYARITYSKRPTRGSGLREQTSTSYYRRSTNHTDPGTRSTA
jgi:hypothetical protein